MVLVGVRDGLTVVGCFETTAVPRGIRRPARQSFPKGGFLAADEFSERRITDISHAEPGLARKNRGFWHTIL